MNIIRLNKLMLYGIPTYIWCNYILSKLISGFFQLILGSKWGKETVEVIHHCISWPSDQMCYLK